MVTMVCGCQPGHTATTHIPFGRFKVMSPTFSPVPTLDTLMCVYFGASDDEARATITTARPLHTAAAVGATRATRPTTCLNAINDMVPKLKVCCISDEKKYKCELHLLVVVII